MTRLVTGVADAQQTGSSKTQWGLLREFTASGLSVGCANTLLNPVEVIKTRMQLNGAAATAAATTAPVTPALPAVASSASSSVSTGRPAFPQAQVARLFSSTSAFRGVPGATAGGPTLAAAAAALTHLEQPAAATATVTGSSGSVAAASTEHSLLATLQAATAGINHAAISRSSNSRPHHPLGLLQSCHIKRPGFWATAGIIAREEGSSAFTKGIQASATRAVLNGGIRLGLYDPIKTLMSADGSGRDLHMGQKLAAGSISGGIGAVLTTPIELAKTRLQAPSANTRSMWVVLRGVMSDQGPSGLWRGATPSVLRLILLNGSMVATYDEVKGRIRTLTGWSSGVQLVLASSMVAGLVTTTVINPADVVRAYMQTGRGSSLVGVARNILQREGPAGFLKGWTAAYARTGPQTLIIFTVSELVRPLFGLTVIGGSG